MSQTQVSFSLFARSAQQQSECPPAGASQEVNEAAPSLAAPSASGQQAGTPSWLYGGAEAVEMAKADGWVPDVGLASGQQAGTRSVYPLEIAALLPELRLPFSLVKTMGGWYLAIGCTRSPKWGRVSIQQAGRA